MNAGRPAGLQAHMVAQPGGGAPAIYPASILEEHWGAEAGPGARHVGGEEAGDPRGNLEGNGPPESCSCSGLLVLLPLTLGLDKVLHPGWVNPCLQLCCSRDCMIGGITIMVPLMRSVISTRRSCVGGWI